MTARVSVITPTCDRPAGIALLERWMARQTRQPDEWIVADGGQTPAVCTMGQRHRHHARPAGATNFAMNLLGALEWVTGTVVIVAEDDDWYAANHIETLVAQLARPGVLIAGDDQQRYYNVPHRKWRLFNNKGASLCQTGMARAVLPAFTTAIEKCLRAKTYGIDGALWASQPDRARSLVRASTVLGIKGLPGQVGLGIGHRPLAGWTSDPQGARLRAWIGADAEWYLDRLKASA